jgi:hypothetical protein
LNIVGSSGCNSLGEGSEKDKKVIKTPTANATCFFMAVVVGVLVGCEELKCTRSDFIASSGCKNYYGIRTFFVLIWSVIFNESKYSPEGSLLVGFK